MAEAARRTGYGHGSDVVRRLIARPIRMQATQPARPAVAEPVAVAAPEIDAGVESPDLPEQDLPEQDLPEQDLPETDTPDIARLRTELMLLKAVLHAERQENASLRAAAGLGQADELLGDEARALRDRWACLVDRLLHAPA